jgi:arylsulfatase
VDTYKQSSTKPIPTGDVRLTMLFEADEPKPGTGGEVTLLANGEVIGSGRIPRTVSLIYTTYAGMDMGRDNGGVVDLDYEDKAPYAFTGTLNEVVFDLKPRALEDEEELHRSGSQAGLAHGAAG